MNFPTGGGHPSSAHVLAGKLFGAGISSGQVGAPRAPRGALRRLRAAAPPSRDSAQRSLRSPLRGEKRRRASESLVTARLCIYETASPSSRINASLSQTHVPLERRRRQVVT